MKKYIIIPFLFLSLSILHASDIREHELEFITELAIGNIPGEIGINLLAPSEQGPSSFAFDNNGYLYISDIINNKMIIYNSSYQFERELDNGCIANQLFIDNMIFCFNTYNFKIYNMSGELLVHVFFDKQYESKIIKNSCNYSAEKLKKIKKIYENHY